MPVLQQVVRDERPTAAAPEQRARVLRGGPEGGHLRREAKRRAARGANRVLQVREDAGTGRSDRGQSRTGRDVDVARQLPVRRVRQEVPHRRAPSAPPQEHPRQRRVRVRGVRPQVQHPRQAGQALEVALRRESGHVQHLREAVRRRRRLPQAHEGPRGQEAVPGRRPEQKVHRAGPPEGALPHRPRRLPAAAVLPDQAGTRLPPQQDGAARPRQGVQVQRLRQGLCVIAAPGCLARFVVMATY